MAWDHFHARRTGSAHDSGPCCLIKTKLAHIAIVFLPFLVYIYWRIILKVGQWFMNFLSTSWIYICYFSEASVNRSTMWKFVIGYFLLCDLAPIEKNVRGLLCHKYFWYPYQTITVVFSISSAAKQAQFHLTRTIVGELNKWRLIMVLEK